MWRPLSCGFQPLPTQLSKQHHRHYQDFIYSLLLCKDTMFCVHLSSYMHHFFVYNVLYSSVYCFFLWKTSKNVKFWQIFLHSLIFFSPSNWTGQNNLSSSSSQKKSWYIPFNWGNQHYLFGEWVSESWKHIEPNVDVMCEHQASFVWQPWGNRCCSGVCLHI